MQKSKRKEMRGQFDFFFFFTVRASLQGVKNYACSQHKRKEPKEAVTITKTSNRISVVHCHGQKTKVRKLSGHWLCLRTYDCKQTNRVLAKKLEQPDRMPVLNVSALVMVKIDTLYYNLRN